ncbi:type II toxin-antitoxin system VapC family toxin [Pleomorphomonas carboxyditropha]|uniref:PIN domain-containing protein n=1 Tax=Pleomorphomonas carboxyditropha TaxID=2023338 RepID=A0A2G9WT48_9HYPH|nr:PIN domain-containing protein [Pleomorphomonas carboxyditropha]PIO97873.1 hypothetical protein CJ014_18455 [Pleomorphomonas carboxyditropha]
MSDPLVPNDSVFFDSNALIFAFEAGSRWSAALGALLAKIEAGRMRGVVSELSLAEILVKPLAEGAQSHVELYERLFDSDSPLEIIPVDRPVIRESAQLQATTGLKLADALLVASAVRAGCRHFLSADVRLGRKLGADLAWLHPDELGGTNT